jgi:hypothetical protein
VLLAKEFLYVEYYPTPQDLEIFLSGVPIFTDFEPEKDKALLEAYIAKHTTKKGIELERHRVVIVARKNQKNNK